MEFNLSETDKDWIELTLQKDFTKLQMKRKLKEARYTDKRIEEFARYFDYVKNKEDEEEQKVKRDVKEEEKLEKSVSKYLEDGGKDLSWGEKREIKKFLKNITKYKETLKIALDGIRKEIEIISTNEKFSNRIDKELQDPKEEIIDRIIDSKQVLEVEDPVTKEEATKESLSKHDIKLLIKLLEDNVEVLDALTNGKIRE